MAGNASCGNPQSFIGIGSSLNGQAAGNQMLCNCSSDNGYQNITVASWIFVRQTYEVVLLTIVDFPAPS